MLTRRGFGRLALAALPAAAALGKISSKIHGVEIGVAGFSYNSLPRRGLLDVIVQSMKDIGLGDCLLYAPATEPVELADKARPARGGTGRGPGRAPQTPEQLAAIEELRKWHLTAPLAYCTAIRKKFGDAGVAIHSYDAALAATATDEEIAKALEVTKAIGAQFMMCAVPRSTAKRIAPLADRKGVKAGFQGRPNMASRDPDVMAKPADFEETMSFSKNFGTCIDVGDATGGGWDALKFVQDTHSRVFALNMKDRTRANISVRWGEGDTRVKDILQLVRDKKYPVRCYIDCEYALPEGSSRIDEIRRCFDFAKAALA